MQTFLPYRDFDKSAQALDRKRLFKQIIEARQILCATLDPAYGWQHHPVTGMWRGFPYALCEYMNACIAEYMSRGYKTSVLPASLPEQYRYPAWLDNPLTFSKYRAHLLSKDSWYMQWGWTEHPEPITDYLWTKQ